MGWCEVFRGHILVLVGAAYHLLTGGTRSPDLGIRHYLGFLDGI
uniref:Uncharacterized protein n=1 Tax=Candidatus Methanogaster sp. ANME-2c ERB4 TaxID=2759911 RepID=A0A7G9YFF4_9EURY|nr:hypothetical protein EIOBDEGA_00026 [Methanosarcinales archaeon ANME-2c ERB4]